MGSIIVRIDVVQVQVLEKELRLPLITPELETLCYLYKNGPTPARVLQAQSRISPAGFQIMKKRLLLNAIISGSKCSDDLRVMLYDLSDRVRQTVDAMHQERAGGGSPLCEMTSGT